MDRTSKEQAVTALNKDLAAAQGVLLTKNLGLDADGIYSLRKKVRAAGARVVVAKNRLADRALSGTQFESLKTHLKGPVALVISSDTIAAAKVIMTFAKTNEKLQVVAGMMEKEAYDAKGIETLSKLPGINELRAGLVGLLQAPAAQLARVLKAHADKNGGETQSAAS